MNRTRRVSAVASVAAMGLLLAACGGDTPAAAPTSASAPASETPSATPKATTNANDAALERFRKQKLTWKKCNQGAQCTTVVVPLDYAKPKGATIKLALVKQTATNPNERLGSLFVNPGGPGGSGYDYVKNAAPVASSVTGHYDVIGWDPRGVTRSAPINCLTDAQSDAFYATDGSPDSAAEATSVFVGGREFADSCVRKEKTDLPFMGTRETIQDLDIMRAAVGDNVLNFMGKSYGTYIGAQYAQKYPDNVGRMVLDGAVDPSLNSDGFAAGQSVGFERALQAFITDCIKKSDCPLGTTKKAANAKLQKYLDGLDTRPQRVGDRVLTQALATLGVLASFYSKSSWPELRDSLTLALRGDGSGLLSLADFYSDRNEDGTYASNSLDIFYATSCLDRPDANGVQSTTALADRLEKVSPIFGPYIAWGNVPCSNWSTPATLQPAKTTAAGAAPILVIGTTRDPATPLEWAESLSQQLQSGVLITRHGDGHTGYTEGNSCVDDTVNAYFNQGVVPKANVDCP